MKSNELQITRNSWASRIKEAILVLLNIIIGPLFGKFSQRRQQILRVVSTFGERLLFTVLLIVKAIGNAI